MDQDTIFYGNLLPLAVGVFWGAPLLAREVEQGTIRLVFTQSVSRRRWLDRQAGCARRHRGRRSASPSARP